MITAGLQGVDFVVANTDAQALTMSKAERIIQMGTAVTEGLGAGSQPDVGAAAANEVIDEIRDHLQGAHMVFVTAGMGGGTGTGAAPVIAKTAREMGILTVGVVTKPFHFEGQRRMRTAESGIIELQKGVDTLLIIPNQNLFRVANEKTTFADAFAMADQVLYSGVACITDLMVKEGLINLDFADVRAVMREMGKAMMGTGEAGGEKRALTAAEAAIANPLIDNSSMRGARGLLISITGGKDLTLFEVDEAATRIREEVDQDANIIVGATFDETLEGIIRVSVVATGIDTPCRPAVRGKPAAAAPVAAQAPRRAGKSSCRPDGAAARRHRQDGRAGRHQPEAPRQAEPRRSARRSSRSAPRSRRSPLQLRRRPRPRRRRPPPTATCRSGRCRRSRRCSRSRRPSRSKCTRAAAPAAFIPPAPEKMPVRPARMPKFEDLPMPAQNEIRQARGEVAAEHPQKSRHVAAAASRQCRPRPARRGDRAADRRPCLGSGHAAGAAGPAQRRACRCRSVRLRSSSARPSRYPSTRAARRRRDLIRTAGRHPLQPPPVRRSSGYPRFPAAPDQLTFCNNRPHSPESRLFAAGIFSFEHRDRVPSIAFDFI